MRRGRPSLLGTVARTAVISATATSVSSDVAQRKARGHAAQAAPPPVVAAPPPPVAAAAPPAPAPSSTDERLQQLTRLGELRSAGVLTEAEFEMEKHRILRG